MSIKIITFISGYLSNNTYLIYDKELSSSAILIDPAESFDLVFNHLNIEKLKLTDVLLTHAHFDHICDTCKFVDLGAKVHLHKNELPNFNSQLTKHRLATKSRTLPLIDYFFVDGEKYCLPFCKIEIFHTPGHSSGSSCFLLEKNIFSGDTLFKLSYGRTDFFDGSFSEILSSIKRLFSFDETIKVFPGHGDCTDLNFEKKYNPIKDYII